MVGQVQVRQADIVLSIGHARQSGLHLARLLVEVAPERMGNNEPPRFNVSVAGMNLRSLPVTRVWLVHEAKDDEAAELCVRED
jgi:hypothetical protein